MACLGSHGCSVHLGSLCVFAHFVSTWCLQPCVWFVVVGCVAVHSPHVSVPTPDPTPARSWMGSWKGVWVKQQGRGFKASDIAKKGLWKQGLNIRRDFTFLWFEWTVSTHSDYLCLLEATWCSSRTILAGKTWPQLLQKLTHAHSVSLLIAVSWPPQAKELVDWILIMQGCSSAHRTTRLRLCFNMGHCSTEDLIMVHSIDPVLLPFKTGACTNAPLHLVFPLHTFFCFSFT